MFEEWFSVLSHVKVLTAPRSWLLIGRALTQVLNLSKKASLLPNKTLTQCFWEIQSLEIFEGELPPQTEIQYTR